MSSATHGKKHTDFDILHKQKDDTALEYKIPIRKIGFDDTPKPTELPPLKVVKHESDETDTNHVAEDNKFCPPKELLNYLDQLIVKKKLPLRTLKFDIEFSKSNGEIAGYLEHYVEKSNLIDVKDLDKLYSFIGYEREPGEFIEVKNEKIEKKEHVEDQKHESNGETLDTVRDEYISILAPYISKIKKDKLLFRKIMSELGGINEMPEKSEPRELVEARGEYLKAKKKIIKNFEEEIAETEILRNTLYKNLGDKTQKTLEKANKSWDGYENIILVSEALMSKDINQLSKIIEPHTYDGIRVKMDFPITEDAVAPIEVLKIAPEIPKLEAKEEPLIKIQPVENEVAEKDDLVQNAVSIQFEGKKIEIIKGGGKNKDEITVLLDGSLIAEGYMSWRGPKVKICPQYKAGFLLAPTPEENALKYAMPTIKSLK